MSVHLPAPLGPTSATFSPRAIVEVDAAQRLEAVRVGVVEVLDLDPARRLRRPGVAGSRAGWSAW